MQFFFSVLQNALPLVSDNSTDVAVRAEVDKVSISKKENTASRK